jgi:hypothetical protein
MAADGLAPVPPAVRDKEIGIQEVRGLIAASGGRYE